MASSISTHERYAKHVLSNNLRSLAHEAEIIDATFAMHGPFGLDDIRAKLPANLTEREFWEVFNRLGAAHMIRLVKFNGQMVYVVTSPE